MQVIYDAARGVIVLWIEAFSFQDIFHEYER